MDEATKNWLEKIENRLLEFKESYIEKSTEIGTKLDSLIITHSDHDTRLRDLEEFQHKQEGIETSNNRRLTKWGVVIIGLEVLIGIAIAVFAKS